MLRLKIPGGHLTSAQLKAIAKAVSGPEGEIADLTSGREIELPGVPSAPSPEILSLLQMAGMIPQESSASFGEPSPAVPEPVGVWEQQEPGLFSLGVPVLAGRLSGGQMRKLADVVERYGAGSLRLTAGQDVLIPNVPKEKVAQALEALDAVDLRIAASPFRRGLVVCGRGDRERAKELVSHLEKQVPLEEPFRIHWSDAPCGCAGFSSAQIAIEGGDSYDVTIGGFTAAGVPAGQLKQRIENLLVRYKRTRGPAEPFGDFCARAGEEELRRLLLGDPESRPG